MTADELIARFERKRLKEILHAFGVDPEDPEKALQELDEACESQLREADQESKEPAEIRKARRLYAFFRFLIDDSKGPKWQALRESENLDRDDLVVRVWRRLETSHRDAIEKQYHSLEYHRLWLFDWFLRRYNIRCAREVAGGGKWAQYAHFFLLAAVAVVFALRRFELLRPYETFKTLLFCGFAYGGVLTALALSFKLSKKLPDVVEVFAVATHSLIPRLAGAGAVGLVILASSQELLKVVVGTQWWWLIGFLFAGYVYLLLEMARRIHPMPRARRLAIHGLDVATTALAHSAALALLAEGGLRRVLKEDYPPFDWWQSLSVVIFVFTIGLVVNLIWAEQPVTEPL